jgi:hypothetical protein
VLIVEIVMFMQDIQAGHGADGAALGMRTSSREVAGESERNPFDLMTQQPFLGERSLLDGETAAEPSCCSSSSCMALQHACPGAHTQDMCWLLKCSEDVVPTFLPVSR